MKTEGVKGYQDDDKTWQTIKDLEKMSLFNPAIMNTWCDRTAMRHGKHTYPSQMQAFILIKDGH